MTTIERASLGQYLKSLQDPSGHPGAKVPDLVSFPSSTFTLSLEFQLKSLATGTDMLGVILTPYVKAADGLGFEPIQIGRNSTLGYGPITWTPRSWTEKAVVTSLYEWCRPVSAELSCEYIGNSVEDQGQFIMGLLPRTEIANGPEYALADGQAARENQFSQTALVKDGWCKVVWKPQDSKDLEYQQEIANDASEVPPSIYIMMTDLKPQVSSFRIKVLCNFEGIPKRDTFSLINATPSPVNVSELEGAMRWAGRGMNNFYSAAKGFSPFLRPMAEGLMSNLAPRIGSALGRNLLL